MSLIIYINLYEDLIIVSDKYSAIFDKEKAYAQIKKIETKKKKNKKKEININKKKKNNKNLKEVRYDINLLLSKDINEFKTRKYEFDKLTEIRELLLKGYYKSALTMALLLPDVCSKIAYPELKDLDESKSHKYEKWYNEYVFKTEIGNYGIDASHFDCFNGKMAYLLRCRLVHGDEKDIEELVNRPESSFIKKGYKKVYFNLTDFDFSILLSIKNDKNEIFSLIMRSVPQIVLSILSCTDELYKKTDDKNLFFDGCNILSIKDF